MSTLQYNPGRTRSGALGTDEQTAGLITTNHEIDMRVFSPDERVGRPASVNSSELRKQGYRFMDTQFSLGQDPYGLCHIFPGSLLMTYKKSPPTDTRSGKNLAEVRQNVFAVWNGYAIPPNIKTQDQYERLFAAASFSAGFYSYGAIKQHDSGGAGELRGGRSINWRSVEYGWPGDLFMWTAPLIDEEAREQQDRTIPSDGQHPIHRREPIFKIFRPERDVPQYMRHVITTQFSEDSKLLSNVAYERSEALNAQKNLNPDIIPTPELDTDQDVWYSHVDASMDALMQQLIVLWQAGVISINAPPVGGQVPAHLHPNSNLKVGDLGAKRYNGAGGQAAPLAAADYAQLAWLATLLGRFTGSSRQSCTAVVRECLGRANHGFMNNITSAVTKSYSVERTFPSLQQPGYGVVAQNAVPMTQELTALKQQLSKSQKQAPQRRLAADSTAYRAMANRVVGELSSTATPGAIVDIVF